MIKNPNIAVPLCSFDMNLIQILEFIALPAALLFLVLVIIENIWCWLFGIISSLIYAYIMYQSQVYSESVLYIIYVILGFFGWYKWYNSSPKDNSIKQANVKIHIVIISLGIILSLGLGQLMKYYLTDAFRPFADAFSTVFSLIATYMEAYKWLSAWIFWIIINIFSLWLYFDRGLKTSSILMLVYFVFSIVGYLEWRRRYLKQIPTL